MTDFGKRKSKQNTKKLWVFGSRKISLTFLHEIFLKKNHSKSSKTFPKQENFLQKNLRKNSQRGFPRFSKNSFKEKCPFPKSFLKKMLKSLSENPSKSLPKSPPKKKIIQSPLKVPPFSQHKSPFYRRRFRKYFQIKNLFSKKTQE